MTTPTERQQTRPGGSRMPVLFVGHGSPMNVVEGNRWSRGFSALRSLVPRPSAILAISAHWFANGICLTGSASPKTIHDFSGFPRALYEIEYPAQGNIEFARRVRGMLSAEQVGLSTDWGYDHGTWSVLRWMFPEADIPVIQLSIDRRLEVRRHYELGLALAELRDDGVLILGSGNAVHNLSDAFGRMQAGSTETPDWAHGFDEAVKQAVTEHDTTRLLTLWPDTDDGRMAHPTPDHWLPLIYAYGAIERGDGVRFPTEGFDLGSISMRNIVFG